LEARKDILWRSYLVYLAIVLFGVGIASRAFYIQRVEGNYWKALSDSLQLDYRAMDAERGTIYSEDGRMLSSSVPYFDIYLDFGSDAIQENDGKIFKKNVDSLALNLESILNDHSAAYYKKTLVRVFNEKQRYQLLKRNIDYKQYQQLRSTSFIKKNKNKNGFIFVEKEKRIAPFGLLANRTIGLAREYTGQDGKLVVNNVGLERTYDSLLKGVSGKQLVRRIAGGAYVPVEGVEIDAENGKDIITTLDVNIQDIAEQALLKILIKNEALKGSCIVMEVKTGKIKAIANLGRSANGTYSENYNNAITRSEPGSTFKLVTMIALLEDQLTNLNEQVNLEGGKWDVGGKTVYDSEVHGKTNVTVQNAFELSSNVGMAKLVSANYGSNPSKFLSHIKRLHLNTRSGLDLVGESFPIIPEPSKRGWSNISLPWMGFGYGVAISPLQMLMVYNAVANNGRLMQPYLVNAIAKDGIMLQEFKPRVLEDSMFRHSTLVQLKTCLEGVVERGTGISMKTSAYRIAGKTGTAKVANGSKGYFEHQYQSSFAGYFPADNPKYSCIVVIENKPYLERYYGAQVAGPVFREIADKLFMVDPELYANYHHDIKQDNLLQHFSWKGANKDFVKIATKLGVAIKDTGVQGDVAIMGTANGSLMGSSSKADGITMPDLKGMGLRDAMELLDKIKLNVIAPGNGKVIMQSIQPGASISKGQTIYLTLGAQVN
jgi:cell division protein FtsI (penicillin-binding protein 3)